MAGRGNKYPVFVAELVGEVSGMMMVRGATEEGAMAFALEVGEYVIRTWGGERVYIPKGYYFSCAARDAIIYQEFDGTNYRDLARKYGLTQRRITSIIGTERAAKALRKKSGRDEASGD